MKELERLHTWMFADFECILPEDGHTRGLETITASHHPCSFALVVCSDYPELEYFTVYTGKDKLDTMEKFCNLILEISTNVYQFYCSMHEPMKPLNSLEQRNHVKADKCYLCGDEFDTLVWSKNKCCDHDHVTGLYIGAACRACNLARALKKQFIPLFFHNGKNYDLHLVIKEITKRKYGCVFDGIPENGQKLLSLTIKKYHPDDRGRNYESKKTMCTLGLLTTLGFCFQGLRRTQMP